jgi:Fe-Mn family superoxide dismutase
MSAAQQQCLPVQGIDLWEHAYYLEHMWDRYSYIASWWEDVDWSLVEDFYNDFAVEGRAVSLVQRGL